MRFLVEKYGFLYGIWCGLVMRCLICEIHYYDTLWHMVWSGIEGEIEGIGDYRLSFLSKVVK